MPRDPVDRVLDIKPIEQPEEYLQAARRLCDLRLSYPDSKPLSLPSAYQIVVKARTQTHKDPAYKEHEF